jgi:hypothetical protein
VFPDKQAIAPNHAENPEHNSMATPCDVKGEGTRPIGATGHGPAKQADEPSQLPVDTPLQLPVVYRAGGGWQYRVAAKAASSMSQV